MKGKTQTHRSGPVSATVILCVISICISSGYTNKAAANGLPHYRVFTFKNITTEQAEQYLKEINIGTASKLPIKQTLLVTASAQDLIKAAAFIKLVDSSEKFEITRAFDAAEVNNLPTESLVEQYLTDITIGTFFSPPVALNKIKAIMDVHDNSVMIIAPVGYGEKILQTIKKLKNTEPLTDTSQDQIIEEAENIYEIIDISTETDDILEINEADSKLLRKETIIAEPSDDEMLSNMLDQLAESEHTQEPAIEDININEMISEDLDQQKNQIQLETEKQTSASEMKVERLERELQLLKNRVSQILDGQEKTDQQEKESLDENESHLKLSDGELAPEAQEVIERTKRDYNPKPVEYGNEMLELNLPEKLSVIDLLGLVGQYMHLDYMYNEADIKGHEVTLRLQGPVQVKELYPLVENILKFKGLVMSRKGNLVTIVPTARVLELDPVLIHEEGGSIQYGDVIVTRILDLYYIDAESAKNLLEGMKMGVNINTSASSVGKIIVTGFASQMVRIDELLKIIDKPGEPKKFRYRQLRYTMADTLVPKIKTLAEQLGTISVSVSAQPAAKPGRKSRRSSKITKKPQTAKSTAEKTSVFLDSDERTNRVLMIGFDHELKIVNSLIDTLDVEQQDLRAMRLYEIQYVGAEDVLDKLGELGIISSSKSSSRSNSSDRRSSRTSVKNQKKSTSLESYGSGTETLVEEPQVVIVEATNSLLVNATAEQHAQIATIIAYVDSETIEKAIPYEIYALENQDPETIAEILNQLIAETVKDKEGKIEKVVKTNEDAIVIVPDENTFSVIVYASKKNQEWIKKLIRTLDKRRPQVLIDVTLVEITNNDSFTYDLDLVTKLPYMGGGGTMDALTGFIDPFPVGSIREFTSSAGKLTGFYSNEHVQALLEIMQKKGYGRVLAQPRLLVNDNEEGMIDTKRTTYVARKSTNHFGDKNDDVETSYTFDPFESGIDLSITPHISEGQLLRLEISMGRSDQESASEIGENEPPPDKTENNIETIVTVPDNSTIILGGIIQLNQSKGGSKVPLLGDLPLIGGLFRSIDNSGTGSKLYIFVKANILRPSDGGDSLPQLKEISERKRKAFEKAEEDFQQYQDWPGLDAEPMDPLKVLEAE